MNVKTVLLLALALPFASCGGKNGSAKLDTPTSGTIHISVDESYRPMMEAEIEMFESIYKNAHINVSYTSEAKAFKDLLADSSRFIITNRELTTEEMAYFNERKIPPRTTHIADDGLAFIVHPENPLERLLYSQVGDLFSGSTSSWKQIDPQLAADSIRIVFDSPESGNVRMIDETFKLGGKLPANCFALNTNAEVISFIEKNPGAIGIISVNWISDNADSTTIEFMKKIKVLDIGSVDTKDSLGTFYGPYQAYISNNAYPFIRKTYIVSREARAGLGTGFAAFIAGDKGQRIILRSGMVPAVAPVRIVNISN